MMELKVTQNYKGRFNLLSNKEELSFYMGIYDENNKCVEVDGIKCILHFSGDEEPFNNPFENIEYVYEKCWEYANSIISSTDYKAQCKTFAKVYQENFKLLDSQLLTKHKESIQKTIEKLQKELNKTSILSDLSYIYNSLINDNIRKLKNSIEQYEKWIQSYKEESKEFADYTEKIAKTKEKIEQYKTEFIKEPEE
jgi:methyl-accepting chemotaxis protein